MEQRRRRKYQAQKRALVVCRDLRRFFGVAPGGRHAVTTLEHAVAVQAARHRTQEQCRLDQKTAADRGRTARRFLYVGLSFVAVVSRRVRDAIDTVPVFDMPAWTSDAVLIARAEAMVGVASAHEELFVKKGLTPGFLARLSSEIAALKTAKDAVTRARARFTASTVAFDRALDEGKAAIAVLDGILGTSKDSPVGALTALHQAKRIGPRVMEDGQTSDLLVRQLFVRQPFVRQPASLLRPEVFSLRSFIPLARAG